MTAPTGGAGGIPPQALTNPLQLLAIAQAVLPAQVNSARMILDGKIYVVVQVQNAGGASTAFLEVDVALQVCDQIRAMALGLSLPAGASPRKENGNTVHRFKVERGQRGDRPAGDS